MSIRMSPLGSDGEEVAGNGESGTPEVTETRSVVAPAQVKGELFVGIGKREKAMVDVEEMLVGAVRTFDFTIVPRSSDADQLMPDAIVS